MIIDPVTLLIAIGQATVTFTLNLDGNGKRKRLFGFSTGFCVFSHA